MKRLLVHRISKLVGLILLLAELGPPFLVSQEKKANERTSTQERSATSIGKRVFATTCASCHGLDGLGSQRAPNIVTNAQLQRLSEKEILRIVSDGVPGTGMPAFRSLGAPSLHAVVRYLRALEGKHGAQPLPGDPQQGKALFFGKAECSACHMASGAGGFIAPDLTTYARTHTAEQIRAAITNPASRDAPKGMVTVISSDGRQYQGVVRNEDNFSLQLEDREGAFHLLMKSEVKSITREANSIMPSDYASRLTEAELNDLVHYVVSLAGSPTLQTGNEQDDK